MGEPRRERILSELARRRFMSIGDVVSSVGCSVATARRDLDALARAGLLRRSRGGAIALAVYDGSMPATPGSEAADPFAAEKRRIAAAAAALVADGDTVALGGGSTTLEVARALRGRKLGAVTNAIPLAQELAAEPGTRVVLIGGVLNTGADELVGPLAEGMLAQVRIDLLFVSVDGLSVEAGATIIGDLEAQVLRAMAARARRVVVVADRRKIGRTALTQVLPLGAVSALVTDAAATPARDAIQAAGVEIIQV